MDLIGEYEISLRKIKEKRFHVRKPINTYMLEEKIALLEEGIDIYRRSFKKINNDIKEKLDILYEKRVPEENVKATENREKGFTKIHNDALKILKNRKTFYDKVVETKK